MDKFICYVPFWFKGAKNRWYGWRTMYLLAGIVLCMLLNSLFSTDNQCKLPSHINNKSITLFIKYGVRLY